MRRAKPAGGDEGALGSVEIAESGRAETGSRFRFAGSGLSRRRSGVRMGTPSKRRVDEAMGAAWSVHAGALSRNPGKLLATADGARDAAEKAARLAMERGEVVHLRAGARYVTVPPGVDVDVLKAAAMQIER